MFSIMFGAASPALAHDELVGTEATVTEDQAAVALTLHFNNEVMQTGTEFIATSADGADLLQGIPEIAGRSVTQLITMPEFGKIVTVAWRVVSSDGHPISGQLALVATEGANGAEVELTDVPASAEDADEAEHDHEHDADHADAAQAPVSSTSERELWTPDVLWTVFTIILISLAGTAAIIAIKRSQQRRRSVGGSGGGSGSGSGSDGSHADDTGSNGSNGSNAGKN